MKEKLKNEEKFVFLALGVVKCFSFSLKAESSK
jgi:hypothetical protein